MTAKPTSPRLTSPRRWSTLAAASVSLAVGGAAQGEIRLPRLAIYAAPAEATLWTVQAEGGEGGEAGAVAGAAPDVAYLAQLSIVEGHLLAADALYRKGQVGDAIGLSYHPEAEMMEEVRANLAAHGAADFTPQMAAFSAALEKTAPQAEVDAALADFRAAVAAAQAPQAAEVKSRFAALVVVTKAAASEYQGSIEAGSVSDAMAYHEAYAFLAIARDLATDLQGDPLAGKAAGRALEVLAEADTAFGDMAQTTLEARDPAILLAIAARLELIGSTVR